MSRLNLIALMGLALLTAAAGAFANIQDKQRMLIAHTLQSAPAELTIVAAEPVRPMLFTAETSASTQVPAIKPISCKLIDRSGRPIKPGSVAILGNDLYFLGPADLWCASGGVQLLLKQQCPILTCTALGPVEHEINGVPVQEFCDLVYFPQHKSLIVLEKSGDLLEFIPASGTWRVAWPNKPITYSPDPDFISLAARQDEIVLLDPERNELWQFDGRNLTRLITPEVLPWKAQRSKPNLADGIAVCQDGSIFVLKRRGVITEYAGKKRVIAVRQLNCKPFGWLRPTRICSVPENLLIADREHNAIVSLSKPSGAAKAQFFAPNSDLRGLCAVPGGIFMINGDSLMYLPLSSFASAAATRGPYSSRCLDARLQKLRLPLARSRLPYHPGVWPGARRLYRYGVHKGVDFFYDTGCGITIKTDTPVHAAADGKIIRIDGNFKDLTEKRYAKIMRECICSHTTSDSNENLLRGCQVWIDHGAGLITKYAHLDHVNHTLREGDRIKCGTVIGYVGVSGTGENLPGRVKQPHLHFEVWLDGNYLGYGLTPAETITLLERIFGCGC